MVKGRSLLRWRDITFAFALGVFLSSSIFYVFYGRRARTSDAGSLEVGWQPPRDAADDIEAPAFADERDPGSPLLGQQTDEHLPWSPKGDEVSGFPPSGRARSSLDTKPALVVYTFSTSLHIGPERFLSTTRALGYQVIVLGMGEEYTGNGLKLVRLKQALETLLISGNLNQTVVLFVDCFDLVLLAPAEETIEKFLEHHTPGTVIMSAEFFLWPKIELHPLYDAKLSKQHIWNYGNSGSFIGYGTDVLQVLTRLCMRVPSSTPVEQLPSDQVLWNLEHLSQFPQRVKALNLTHSAPFIEAHKPYRKVGAFPVLNRQSDVSAIEWKTRLNRCISPLIPSMAYFLPMSAGQEVPDGIKVVLDRNCEFFQTHGGVSPAIKSMLSVKLTPEGLPRIHNRVTHTKPVLWHTPGDYFIDFHPVANVAAGWKLTDSGHPGAPPLGASSWHKPADYPPVTIAVFLDYPPSLMREKGGPEEWVASFYSQFRELAYPLQQRAKLVVDSVHESLLPSKEIRELFLEVRTVVHSSPPVKRKPNEAEHWWMLQCMHKRRMDVIREWKKQEGEFIIWMTAEHRILEPRALQLLMDRNLAYLSPMLPAGQDEHDSSFWVGWFMNAEIPASVSVDPFFPGYYASLRDRKRLGCFSVALIMGPVLLRRDFDLEPLDWEEKEPFHKFEKVNHPGWILKVKHAHAIDVLWSSDLVNRGYHIFIDNTRVWGKWEAVADWRKTLEAKTYGWIG